MYTSLRKKNYRLASEVFFWSDETAKYSCAVRVDKYDIFCETYLHTYRVKYTSYFFLFSENIISWILMLNSFSILNSVLPCEWFFAAYNFSKNIYLKQTIYHHAIHTFILSVVSVNKFSCKKNIYIRLWSFVFSFFWLYHCINFVISGFELNLNVKKLFKIINMPRPEVKLSFCLIGSFYEFMYIFLHLNIYA